MNLRRTVVVFSFFVYIGGIIVGGTPATRVPCGRDRNVFQCLEMASKNACNDSNVRLHCPNACKVCDPLDVTSPPSTRAETPAMATVTLWRRDVLCSSDLKEHHQCSTLASSGYCRARNIRQQCPISCNACVNTVGPTTATTTTTAPSMGASTIKAATRSAGNVRGECRNLGGDEFCKNFTKSGWCTLLPTVAESCKLSCSLCTTFPPTTAKTTRSTTNTLPQTNTVRITPASTTAAETTRAKTTRATVRTTAEVSTTIASTRATSTTKPCADLLGSAFCQRNVADCGDKMMDHLCAATCRRCKRGKERPCENAMSAHFCTSKLSSCTEPFMRKHCAAACGSCGEFGKSTPGVTSSVPPTISQTTQTTDLPNTANLEKTSMNATPSTANHGDSTTDGAGKELPENCKPAHGVNINVNANGGTGSVVQRLMDVIRNKFSIGRKGDCANRARNINVNINANIINYDKNNAGLGNKEGIQSTVQIPSSNSTIRTASPYTKTTLVSTTTEAAGFSCQKCEPSANGSCSNARREVCDVSKQFCMNTLEDKADGTRVFRKSGCVTRDVCITDWYVQSMDSKECLQLLKGPLKRLTHECHFCCTTSGCNVADIPPQDTLFSN